MDHPEVAFKEELLLRGKLEQLPALGRNPDPAGSGIQDPQAGPRGVGRHAETGFALAQRHLGLLAGEGVGKHLRDELESHHGCLRPMSFFAHDRKGQQAQNRSVSHG